MNARGKRRRSSATRASSAAASGSGPPTTSTDVAMVVIRASRRAEAGFARRSPSREGSGTLRGFPSRTDQAQLAQARWLLDGDRILVREARVAETFLRPVAGAVDGRVQPLQ